jgi:hypothetical protein
LIADYGGYQLFAAAQTNGLQVRDDYNLILLNAARLDTSQPETQALRQPAGNFAGKRLHLVQFAGPVQPAWRKALLDAGAQIVNYIPHNAYLVYGDAAPWPASNPLPPRACAMGRPVSGPYKIHPAARTAGTNLFAVQLVADAAVNAETIALLAPVERRAASCISSMSSRVWRRRIWTGSPRGPTWFRSTVPSGAQTG